MWIFSVFVAVYCVRIWIVMLLLWQTIKLCSILKFQANINPPVRPPLPPRRVGDFLRLARLSVGVCGGVNGWGWSFFVFVFFFCVRLSLSDCHVFGGFSDVCMCYLFFFEGRVCYDLKRFFFQNEEFCLLVVWIFWCNSVKFFVYIVFFLHVRY